MIYHFGDYDPSGVLIALSMPEIQGMVIPDLDKVNQHVLERLSKEEAFEKQQKYLTGLKVKTSQKHSMNIELIENIKLIEFSHLAVTQEGLIAHKIALKCMEIG